MAFWVHILFINQGTFIFSASFDDAGLLQKTPLRRFGPKGSRLETSSVVLSCLSEGREPGPKEVRGDLEDKLSPLLYALRSSQSVSYPLCTPNAFLKSHLKSSCLLLEM